MLSLADRLHKSIEEVEQTPLTHINEWVAYFKLSSERKE